MKTFFELGEFLANPFVSGLLFTVLVLPIMWGCVKIFQWLKTNFYDFLKSRNQLLE